jgi:preprotein translocase subunit YajC
VPEIHAEERPFVKDLGALLPFVLIALVFWLLIVRPQRRRAKELSDTQRSVAPGAEVMLGSGIFGTVVGVEEDTLRLEVSPGTTMKVAKQAVVRVVEPGVERPDAALDQEHEQDHERDQ